MVYYNTAKRHFKNNSGKLSTEEATKRLQEELESRADQIVQEAEGLAEHAERKTIKEKDVKKAIENISR